MKQRIGLWALSGFVVACCWVMYGMATAPNHNLGHWTVAAITAPASLFGRIVPLTYFSFILLNALTYAAFGLGPELFRPHHR